MSIAGRTHISEHRGENTRQWVSRGEHTSVSIVGRTHGSEYRGENTRQWVSWGEHTLVSIVGRTHVSEYRGENTRQWVSWDEHTSKVLGLWSEVDYLHRSVIKYPSVSRTLSESDTSLLFFLHYENYKRKVF